MSDDSIAMICLTVIFVTGVVCSIYIDRRK